MKNVFKIGLIALAGLALVACGKVPAGNVGVKVHLYGTDKGVSNEVLTPGRYWIGINEELYIFPTFTQNKTWEGKNGEKKFTFQTVEGMVVGADLGISYAVERDSVSDIFEKYRLGIDEITDEYIHNMVRDALVTEASKVRVESVYGNGKEDLIKAIELRVRSQVESIGIKLERIYWIGQLSLPQEVVDKINAKVNADQITSQKVAELEQTRADANKAAEVANGEARALKIRSESEAEANRIISNSLNEQLIRYKQIEKWDGIMPKVTGGATPFVQID